MCTKGVTKPDNSTVKQCISTLRKMNKFIYMKF